MTAQEIKELAWKCYTLSNEEGDLFDLFMLSFREAQESMHRIVEQKMRENHEAQKSPCRPPQEISVEKYVGFRVRQV